MQGATLISFNQTLGAFIIVAQSFAFILTIWLIFPKIVPASIRPFIRKYGLIAAWIVALSAFAGPLIYSENVGFVPCRYCWFQRIATFPQVILLGIASIRRDASIIFYSLPLAIIGVLIGTYHYLLQFGFVGKDGGSSCGAVGQSVACNSLYVFEYGYITIPLMAVTANVLIALILISLRKARAV